MLRTCTECGKPATQFKFWGQPLCLCKTCHHARVKRIEKILQQLMEEDHEVLRGVVQGVEAKLECR
jgi:hypothetical protein